MIRFRWRFLIVISILVVLMVIIGTSIWYGGYMESVIWNHNANITKAIIVYHYIEATPCTCGIHCNTSCYYGYISIAWTVNNVTYTDNKLEIYASYHDPIKLMRKLDMYYTINNTMTIWYLIGDPKNYDLQLKPDNIYYIAFFMVVIISISILVIWGIIELVHLYKKHRLIDEIEIKTIS